MKVYEKYCTGCGLCKAVIGTEFTADEKGFPKPILFKENESFCSKYCPAAGKFVSGDDETVWGKHLSVSYSYSQNDAIRNLASSGGSLTAICLYLIENNLVDGIIQTHSDRNPIKTTTTVSYTRDQIIACAGSRYTISQPLVNIFDLIKDNEKYAFVGKPCDVRTLRLYLEDHKELNDKIPYLFAFFCAGTPSYNAEVKLLKQLDCFDINNAVDLTYRGNGWPGKTILKQSNGMTTSIKYEEAWGNILGRDVRSICRYCLDGVGKAADIAFGDGWYLNENRTPIFDNQKGGRNCTIIRSEKGEEIMAKASALGYIACEKMDDIDITLKATQPYQYERATCMRSMFQALSILGKKTPHYNKKLLKKLSKKIPFKIKIRRFIGTLKRNI